MLNLNLSRFPEPFLLLGFVFQFSYSLGSSLLYKLWHLMLKAVFTVAPENSVLGYYLFSVERAHHQANYTFLAKTAAEVDLGL